MIWGDIYEILKQIKETGIMKTLTTVATKKMVIDPITVKELKVELAAVMDDGVPKDCPFYQCYFWSRE